MADSNAQPQLPAPDPALKRLDRLVGTWSMDGHLVDSDENNIKGQTTFRWLPGGFFLEQHVVLDFMGLEIDSLELIGYDPQNKTFPSTVFSKLSPAPLPYMEVPRRHARTPANTRTTLSPGNQAIPSGSDASRDVARVVSDVAVLCPRVVAG
jgi:hypothetical protein